jgi:hypothetical protein
MPGRGTLPIKTIFQPVTKPLQFLLIFGVFLQLKRFLRIRLKTVLEPITCIGKDIL